MKHTEIYAMQQSELNGFLFADVGVEASGMTLSVLSALARLGMDPWQEAARLAKLPRTAAVEGLARLIAAMPASLWSLPDATPIAARLVALLPTRSASATVAAPVMPTIRIPFGLTWRWAITLALLATLLGSLAVSLASQRSSDSDAIPPFSSIAPAQPSDQVPH